MWKMKLRTQKRNQYKSEKKIFAFIENYILYTVCEWFITALKYSSTDVACT